MTRKHFIELARALSSIRPNTSAPERPTWENAAEAIARACASTNPRFDHDRFMRATRGE